MAHESVQQVFITVLKLWRTTKRSRAEIGALQHERFVNLVRFAREHTRLYRGLYSHLPAGIDDLTRLPIVTKPELMEHFEVWATDPQVTRASVEEFIADPARIGQRYPPFLGAFTSA